MQRQQRNAMQKLVLCGGVPRLEHAIKHVHGISWERAASTCNLLPSSSFFRKRCAPNAPIATPANCRGEMQMVGGGVGGG